MLRIRNGTALIEGELRAADIVIKHEAGRCSLSMWDASDASRTIDARGLLVLPGLVDIHGDAFERQIMPRPGVGFDLDTALFETDRQLAANGITTAFHALTWSWEPGLRGSDSARALVAALERLRSDLVVNTRLHLRQETFNLEAEDEIRGWLAAGRIALLAFNDHLTGLVARPSRPEKLAELAKRASLPIADFQKLVEKVAARASDVPGAIARLAETARSHSVRILSHDDPTTSIRSTYRAMGAHIAEFPTTFEVARDAIAHGDTTVFGAPNVLRGGSHIGFPGAADMAVKGYCSMLASDYYYPALLQAPFVLERKYGMAIAKAWSLVSAAPATAAGLSDRGRIIEGARADLVLVAATTGRPPRVVATIADGRLVYVTETERLAG